jgi:hypothetical protein
MEARQGSLITPKFLFHEIHGYDAGMGKDEIEWASDQIKTEGLLPVVAQAWANLIPKPTRQLPVIWLNEVDRDKWGQTLKISTQSLRKSRLIKLEKEDVDWWVYQGGIPISAICWMEKKM